MSDTAPEFKPTQPHHEKRFGVVMFTDMVGYSRMMGYDPSGTMALLNERHDDLFKRVKEQNGTVINMMGDGSMLEFVDPIAATKCAVDFLQDVVVRNAAMPVDKRLNFRIGIHMGDVYSDGQSIFGDTVNIAARLQQLAEPGGLLVSEPVRSAALGRVGAGFEELGFREVKNVRNAVHVWRMVASSSAARAATAFASDVQNTESPKNSKPALAVLPFSNSSGDEAQAYLAEGLAEDIIASLANSPWVRVIDRNSSFNIPANQMSSAEICEKLDVRYLVRGSVRRGGATLRLTAELIDGGNNEVIWSSRYDRTMDDLFAVQDEVSAAIVGTLEPMFLQHEAKRASGPRDLQHWDLLMRARWNYWRSTRQNIIDAQKMLEAALVLKPDDASTLALLAFSYLIQLWSGWNASPQAAIGEALRLANKAVRADEQDSFAHYALGSALSCTGQLDRAASELRRALDLYPHFAAASGELGRILICMGKTAEGLGYVNRAINASPTDPHTVVWLRSRALACFIDKNYSVAIQHAQEAIGKRTDWSASYFLLAACQAAQGEVDAAQLTIGLTQNMRAGFSRETMQLLDPLTQIEHKERLLAALTLAGWQG